MNQGQHDLRDWMRRRGLNQREAARLIGIHEVFIGQILAALRRPGLRVAVRIQQATGIAPDRWLLSARSESQPRSKRSAKLASVVNS